MAFRILRTLPYSNLPGSHLTSKLISSEACTLYYHPRLNVAQNSRNTVLARQRQLPSATRQVMPLAINEDRETPQKPPTSYIRTLVLCAVILTCLSLGATSLGAPSNRILETALCEKYYRDHDPNAFPPGANIPEEDCKLPEIQTALAYLISTLTISTKLAGLW